MTDDLEDYDSELGQLCADIEKAINNLHKFKGAERTQKEAYLDGRLKRAKEVSRSMRIEIKEAGDAGAGFTTKLQAHNAKINELTGKLKSAQEKELLGDKSGGGGNDVDKMTSDEVLKKAADTQIQSLQSLDRTLLTIETSKQVATETLSEMDRQRQQLEQMMENMDEMQALLKMGGKQLRAFARRLVTDKLIMCFICLIICLIIAVIVLNATLHKSPVKVPDSFSP